MQRRWVLGLLLAVGACGTTTKGEPPRRYAVYFQQWSTALDDPARQVIAAAAGWANGHPTAPVEVAGYADPEGSPQVNVDLSRTRAQMVADGLSAQGVPAARIGIMAHGSVEFTMDFAGVAPGDHHHRQPLSA